MPVIYVRAKPGAIVRESARGKLIPGDTFVPVTMTPQIDRHINYWKDLEVQPSPAPAAAPKKATSDKDEK